jgi:hypothetical protein
VNFLELQSANTFDSNLFPGGEIAQNGVLCLAMTWALYGSVSNEPNLAAAAPLFSFHAQMMWMNDPWSREHFCSQLIPTKIALGGPLVIAAAAVTRPSGAWVGNCKTCLTL